MTDGISINALLTMQQVLESGYGHTYPVENQEELSQQVKDAILALTDELHEALNEVNWKPWVSPRGFKDRDLFVSELIDATHFLLALFLLADCDGDELAQKYRAKWERNLLRQASSSYDGHFGKCVCCHRDIDDLTASSMTPEVCDVALDGLHEFVVGPV